MTNEIIFAGFGGQGVILAGKILALAGMSEDKYVSHIPAYGAEMRGGTANCSVIVSDEEVASPVIENPDVVVALPCDQICAATNNPHGTNMVALSPLFKVVPGMISGVKPFEFALDEAISARNKKFNPINIATIEAAFNRDYEIK